MEGKVVMAKLCRFLLRIRVLPKTAQHLQSQDPVAFQYFYDQVRTIARCVVIATHHICIFHMHTPHKHTFTHAHTTPPSHAHTTHLYTSTHHTPFTCTYHTPSYTHTPHTLYTHIPHTLYTCTLHTPFTHAHSTHPLHMHTPHPFTRTLHTPFTHAHTPTCVSLAHCCCWVVALRKAQCRCDGVVWSIV